jgi:scyllo-inositol 2-dehydrogenase (NADP+)
MAIRSAIIGFGLAGRIFHAPLIQCCAGLQLVSVSTSKRSMVPEGLGTGTPAEIIADPDVDLVVVASPNESHFPLAEAALTAGKHVVVDKPMCVSTDEARKLIELAQRTDLLLTVFHNRRWDSDFLTVRKLIASQALGRVTLFEAHWDRFRPRIAERWREQPTPGTGLLFDLGPHLIDQALALFGPPDQVHADLAAQREGSLVDDYFALRMDYGSCRVILSASSVVAEPRARFSIHGTAGSFVKFGLDQQEDQLRAGMDPLAAEFGLESPSMSGTLTGGDGARSTVPSERGDWLSFYRGVAASIAGRAPTLVEPEDALIGLKIIEAARHSPQGAWRHDATFA